MDDSIMKLMFGEAWALRYYVLFSALTIALGLAGSSLYNDYKQTQVVEQFFETLNLKEVSKKDPSASAVSSLSETNTYINGVVFDTSDITSRVMLI